MPTTESKELLILRAIDFAARNHRDQRRKDAEASSETRANQNLINYVELDTWEIG
jgi:hypothetical protein